MNSENMLETTKTNDDFSIVSTTNVTATPRKNTYKIEKYKKNLNSLRFLMLAGLVGGIAVHGLVRYWGGFTTGSLFIEKAVAQSIPATEQPIPTIYVKGAPTPDWNQITFRSLKFLGEGSVELPSINSPGLKPTRVWSEGQDLSEVMELGDFEGTEFSIEELALEEIADIVGIDLESFTLSDFETLQWQTLADLITALPGLEDLSVDAVPAIADLITSVTGNDSYIGSIGSALNSYPDLAKSQLGEHISLGNYDLTSIPGIESAALEEFSNWQNTAISGVPGLADVPFNRFSSIPVPDLSLIGNIDLPLGSLEENRFKSISGSYQEGFNVSCSSQCAHVELAGNGNLTGAQWMSGKDQKVEGGFGVLGSLNGGKEPTGRHPFGKAFKQVIWEIQEGEGSITTAMSFRICKRGIPDLGCSPYYLGPVSFFNYREKDAIILGAPLAVPASPASVP